jgi:hypothetical protein
VKKSFPTRVLPKHTDVDQLKRQAKELLDAVRAGEPDAVLEAAARYPGADLQKFALHDAQLVLARAHGFQSWPRLKAYLLENTEMLRILLASGMNPDLPTWQRRTFLHDLCSGGKRGQTPEAIERAGILIDAGASISARDEGHRSDGQPGRTCRRWWSFCLPAAHRPISLTTRHGRRPWRGPIGGDMQRSPKSCGNMAPPDNRLGHLLTAGHAGACTGTLLPGRLSSRLGIAG